MPRQPIAALAAEVDRDLRAIRQVLRQPLEADMARGQLTGPQQSAIRALLMSDGLSLKQLSKELGLAHSTVSGIVDRLEQRGMVERQTDEADGRLTRIVVSAQVREWVRDTLPKLQIHPLTHALRAASPGQRRDILRGIRALRLLLDRGRPSASGPAPDPSG